MAGETRYEQLETVGTGRYTTVYRARDRELGREVAVKQIRDEFLGGTLQLDRYWQEAQLLASLQHPNVVTIYDIDRKRGWLVMELMQATLAERLAGRQMDLRSLKTTLAHCLRALHYLHDRGIVHGDIKPSNMMIDARRRIKIGDFGLSRRVSDQDGTLLKGATRYIAPEVVSEDFGEVDASSDLYSLGFSAYELMCGPPFEELALGLGALRSDVTGEDPWIEWHAAPDRRLPRISEVLEGVPQDLAKVIQKLTEKDKSRRYESAEDALSDLNIDVKIIRKDGSGDAAEADSDSTAAEPVNRQRTLAIAAACVSVFLSLLLVFLPGGGPAPTPRDGDTVSDVVVLEEITDNGHRLRVRNMTTGISSDIRLDDDVHVVIARNSNDKEHGAIDDLSPGDRLELKRTADEPPRVVELIVAPSTTHEGVVGGVDVPAARLVLSPQAGDDRDDIEMRIGDGTRMRLNGETGDIADVAPGDHITAVHVLDSGGSGSRLATRVDIRRTMTTVGLVNRIDAAKPRLTLQLQQGASSPGYRSWTLADNANLAGRGAAAAERASWTLKSIEQNMLVEISHDRTISSVTVIQARQPMIRGAINSIDVSTGRLAVKSSNGNVNLPVGKETSVFLNSRPAKLGDLRPDDTAWISAEPDGGRTIMVAAERGAYPHRWSLLIGTSRYRDKSLTPLPFAGGDLKLVANHLEWFYRVPTDGSHSKLLSDTPRAELQKQVTGFLGELRGRAELVVYTTGHVYRGDDDQLWLAPRGFDWENMAETGVSMDWLAEQIESSRGVEKIWLLDVTHAGSGRDLQRQPDGAALLAALGKRLKTTTVIASCGDGQKGLVDPQRRHGLFAWHIATGFRGLADKDADGHVSGNELFDHLGTSLQQDGGRLGGKQSPVRVSPR